GLSNHFDLLNIGVAYNSEGTARSVQGIEWTELGAEDWEEEFGNGLNFKHADCNGDGVVSKEDIAAVELNFGLEHGTHQPDIFLSGNEDDPPFYVDLPAPEDLQQGQPFFAPLLLGSSDLPVDDLYGIAFTIVFDPEIIPPSSVEIQYNPGWLGVADVNLLTFDRTQAGEGRIHVALVRSDQNGVSGYGQVLGFIGIIDNIAGKESLSVEIENVRAIQGNETLIPLNRPVEVVELEPLAASTLQPGGFELFPNPSTDRVWFRLPDGFSVKKLTLSNTNGRTLFLLNDPISELDISNIPAGVYMLKIETEKGVFVERLVKINE
ncbi:MAG TPA: T9SS type A sorting domain-containing protein, partial [Bacteroidetes bacterium]|nr:T9SS type A sorting domain-containing protein [Bacteroidota bacterium]